MFETHVSGILQLFLSRPPLHFNCPSGQVTGHATGHTFPSLPKVFDMHVFGNGHPVLSSPPEQVSSSCEQTVGQKAGQLPVVPANHNV